MFQCCSFRALFVTFPVRKQVHEFMKRRNAAINYADHIHLAFKLKRWRCQSISNSFCCCFSFVIAMLNRIPRLLNSWGRILRETWDGPIRNRLWILGRLIRNRQCILGGPIQKPIRNRMSIWVKESGRTGFSSGRQGCSSEFTSVFALGKSLGTALPPLGKPHPSLLFYLD